MDTEEKPIEPVILPQEKPKRRSIKTQELTVKEKQFAKHVAHGLEKTQAARLAGYKDCGTNAISVNAHRISNRERVKAEIERIQLSRIPKAERIINVLEKIAENEEEESNVRISAIKEWLSTLNFRAENGKDNHNVIKIDNLVASLS